MSCFHGKNIVITGGIGFIGSNLVHTCLKQGGNVTIVDNLDPSAGGNPFNIESVKSEVSVVSCDICDRSVMDDVVKTADLIINSAALISHTLSVQSPFRNLEVNGTAVLQILEAIKTHNPEARFIQLGTTTQIGKCLSGSVDETHPEFPLDPYSAHKTLAEKYVFLYSQVHDLKTNTVRLPNIYGPRSAIHTPALTFNNFFIGLGLQDKEISIYGDGRQLRNILYVDDAVDAILQVAEKGEGSGETYLAVHDDHISVAEFAETVVTQYGKGTVRFIPWPEGRKSIEIGDARYTNKKFKKEIGWAPTTSLREGLAQTRDYYLGCLEKYL